MELEKVLLNNLRSQASLYDIQNQNERIRSHNELANLFANIIANTKVDALFEIGALFAEFSNFMKSTIPNVYAFEASPRNFNLAKDNIDGFEYINCAVSDYDGECDINVLVKSDTGQINIGADSILKRSITTSDEYEVKKVKSITVDTFCKEKDLLDKNIALWIDVEGAAIKVLEGSKNILKNVSAIFIEVEQEEFWQNQGLVGDINKVLFANNFIPIARDFEYENQYNIVYIKSDLVESNIVDISLSMFYNGYATKGLK